MRAAPWIALASLLVTFDLAPAAPPLYPPTSESRHAPSIPGFRAPRAPARPPGVDAPARVRTTVGAQYRAVVILVQFTDRPADTLNHTPADFEDLLFSSGTRPGGSMRDYYAEVSRGAFDIDGIVTRWYTAPRPYAEYTNSQGGFGAAPFNAQQMALDAVRLADPDIDFSGLDNDGPDGVPDSGDDDGEVDALFIVHAGPGGEETGSETEIWSHKWNLPGGPATVDGVLAFSYTTEPEEWGITSPSTTAGDLISIGVFCHEFGHVLGLPDLYDTSGLPGASEGVGEWDLMGSGLYNHRLGEETGSCPAHLSAWSKAMLGWIEPISVSRDSTGITIPPVETSGVAYRLWTNGIDAGEYFLVENRQPIGFDEALVRGTFERDSTAAHGLLILHVDTAILGNNTATHKMVDVEEGGGIEGTSGFEGVQNLDVENGALLSQAACSGGNTGNVVVTGNRGDLYDPWPGAAGRTSFDATGCPNSNSYCGEISQVAIRNIAETGTAPNRDVVADFHVSGTSIRRLAITVNDDSFEGNGNNGNGLAEPGETVRIHVPLLNLDTTPTGILTAKVTLTEPFAGLLADSVYYGVLGGAASDTGSVIYAVINPSPDPRGCNLRIAVSDPAGLVLADSVQFLIGQQTGICDDFESTVVPAPRRWVGASIGCGRVNEWHREAGVNHTPGGAWAWRLGPAGLIGHYAPSQDARLVSQPIRLSGASDTLVFWHRYDSEFAFDGMTIEISTNSGATWTPLVPVGGYNTGDRFSGTQAAFTRVEASLADYSGTVQIAFRFRSEPPNEGLGWWIDDVTVTGSASCTTTGIAIARFDAEPDFDAGRPGVRLSWSVADGAGATVGIDREGDDGPRRRIATQPAWSGEPGTDGGSWRDESVTPGTWRYWLVAARADEPAAEVGPRTVTVGGAPRVLAMNRARPNPFRGGTSFAVSLDRDGPFVVRVFSADGRLVRTLARGTGRPSDLVLTWDGDDDRGRPAGAGIYFFELRSDGRTRVQKAVLLR